MPPVERFFTCLWPLRHTQSVQNDPISVLAEGAPPKLHSLVLKNRMKLATLTHSNNFKWYSFPEHITWSISSQLSRKHYSAIQINGNSTLTLAEEAKYRNSGKRENSDTNWIRILCWYLTLFADLLALLSAACEVLAVDEERPLVEGALWGAELSPPSTADEFRLVLHLFTW